MSILDREKADRPNNEGSLRGIKMNERKDEIIKRIENMDHISFWCYNHYDSSIRDYTQVIPADKSVYWSDLEKLDNPDLSDNEIIRTFNSQEELNTYLMSNDIKLSCISHMLSSFDIKE